MPAKKATGRVTPKKEKKVTSAAEWKAGKTYDLEVPSGHVCLVRKPKGINSFMVDGKIPNSLMPIVQAAMGEKKPGAEGGDGEIDMEAIMKDPSKFNDMLAFVDVIVLNMVVEPKIAPVPTRLGPSGAEEIIPLAERDDSNLYVDEVDVEDKMFILNWALGGTRDLEQFRQATAANVASLGDVSDIPPNTLVTPGDN